MQDSLTLLLNDGSRFDGQSFGYFGETDGEVVFNTAMTGYPESLTDPSYEGQILVMTYPLVGNYGIPDDSEKINNISRYFESERIHIRALVVSEYCEHPFHWNMKETLGVWLSRNKIPAISGIDTRALTQRLREKGTMVGRIMKTSELEKISAKKIKIPDPNASNLVAVVSTKEIKIYKPEKGKIKKTVLLYDCGVKNNILRNFLRRGIQIILVPWDYDIRNMKIPFDGLSVSPGPGDPQMMRNTADNISYAIKKNIPFFGICLGHQLLGIALGGNTYKLKYGHRGVNQPCIDLATKRCYITSQNHGYAVDPKTIPAGFHEWFRNANDGTCEGIMHKSGRFFSVQFHPEASPGPLDTEYLFDRFVEAMGK